MNHGMRSGRFRNAIYFAGAGVICFGMVIFFLFMKNDRSDHGASGDEISEPQQAAHRQPPELHTPTDRPHGARTAGDAASIYAPDEPLSIQLNTLRRLADTKDPYATCILAFALDFCVRGPDRMIVADYAFKDPDDLDDKAISRLAVNDEFRKRYALTCANLSKDDFSDMDQRLLQSARMGNAASMARFALLPFRPGHANQDPNSEFSIAYRQNAESMLNRAAEAGIPEAVKGVYYAYAQGEIISAMGNLKIREDRVKSLAAFRALQLNAEEADKRIAEESLNRDLALLSAPELSRFWQLTTLYSASSKETAKELQFVENVLDDFPEKACAKKTAPGVAATN